MSIAIKRIKRAIQDMPTGGMQTGKQQIKLEYSDAQRAIVEIEVLEAERDTLSAQVEELAKDRDDWKNAMARAASVLLLHKVPTKTINVNKALAEIRAEAVLKFAARLFVKSNKNIDVIDEAKQDADEIRAGEVK